MKRLLGQALRLRPEEFLAVAFFVPSSLVTLRAGLWLQEAGLTVTPRIRHGFIRLAVTAAAMGLFFLFVRARPAWKRLGWIRDLAPFLFCIAIYTNLHDTIHFVNPHDVHDALIRIDAWMFGVQPCVWAQQFYHPLLTDLFSVAYMNYFLISVSVVGWLLVERRPEALRETLFGTILCFYLGYVLYVIFPAAPPRLTLADQFVRDFSGSWLTATQFKIIDVNPTSARGAFPSLHCAITLVTLMYAYKFRKLLFALLVVPGVLLVLATVYLRHHYVIDIFAGFALSVLAYVAAPRVDAAWTRWRQRYAPAPQAEPSDAIPAA